MDLSADSDRRHSVLREMELETWSSPTKDPKMTGAMNNIPIKLMPSTLTDQETMPPLPEKNSSASLEDQINGVIFEADNAEAEESPVFEQQPDTGKTPFQEVQVFSPDQVPKPLAKDETPPKSESQLSDSPREAVENLHVPEQKTESS